jgi:poly(3-hydroxybutyrate) depolymerase
MTELGKQADEKGFVVAFLAGGGVKGAYNNGEPIGDFQDDLKYTRNVIDTLQNDLNIDKDRTYLVGISWGASMMHRAASQLSDKLAGIVDIAGFMTGKETPSSPAGNLSEMSIHSRDDETIRYAGRTGPFESGFGLFRQEPAPYTFNYYRQWNGIGGQPTVSRSQAPNGSNVYTEDIVNPKNGVEVKQVILEGVRHGWPGSFEVPNSISATNETVDFLLRHTRGH